MKLNKDEEKQLSKAKDKLRRLKIFYIHFAFYIIVVALISLNFYVMEEGPYTANITALNNIVLSLWTALLGYILGVHLKADLCLINVGKIKK